MTASPDGWMASGRSPGTAPERDGGFSALQEAFAAAAARLPPERTRLPLTFAGRSVDLDVVGRALFERISPTFEHLVRDAGEAGSALTISVWDEALTGVAAPPASGVADLQWEGRDWRMSSHGAGAGSAHRYLREERTGRTGCLDRLTGDLVLAYRSAAGVSLHEQGRPAARLIAQLYRGFGVVRLHAGLVSHEGTGALIAGGPGRGKTTLALDCLAGGLAYLTDDVAGFIADSDGGHTGFSIYGSANLLPFHLARHPQLAAHARRDGSQDKALLFVAHFAAERMAARTRISTILLPAPSGDPWTRITPLPRRDLLPLLAPATAEHVHAGFGDRDGARLTALVKSARCYRIEPGRDPREVAAAVRSLLESPS